MRFDWDENKNEANKRKHAISFETARLVFNDPLRTSVPDEHPDGDRWHTLGTVDGVVLLLVVHTYREEDEEIIRIISARKATAPERRHYEDSY